MLNIFTPLLKKVNKRFQEDLPAKELFFSKLFSNFDYAQETFFTYHPSVLFFNCPVILNSFSNSKEEQRENH